MAIRKRTGGDADVPRRYYAFVDHVADPGFEDPYKRLFLQLEAVDADYFDGLPDLTDDRRLDPETLFSDRGHAVIRVMTTHNRLAGMGVEAPKEAEWLEVQVGKKGGTPRAWFAAADQDFVVGRAINAPEIGRIFQATRPQLVTKLKNYTTPPKAKKVKAAEVLARMNLGGTDNLQIKALDVGQASCNAFISGKQDLGYFDVGKPLVFNRHSLHPGYKRDWPTDGFVLLSHWDFDHWALAYKNPGLMTLDWYAPEQEVGLLTAKFQQQLGKRLHFITGNASAKGVTLEQAQGKNPKDRNSTGYLLRFERNGEAVLLTGDADYAHISPKMKSGVTALTIPHHGGHGTQPPKPAVFPKPRAVASYGIPNNYKHPDEPHLSAHTNEGWKVKRTAAHGTPIKAPRSDRFLYPLVTLPASPVSSRKQLATV